MLATTVMQQILDADMQDLHCLFECEMLVSTWDKNFSGTADPKFVPQDFRYRIGGCLKRRPKVKIIQMQDFWMTIIQFLKLFEKKKLFFKPGDQNRLVPGVK